MPKKRPVPAAKKDTTVAGYSGSPHEGKRPPARPKGASKDAVIDHIGHTEPTEVFEGDGTTKKKA